MVCRLLAFWDYNFRDFFAVFCLGCCCQGGCADVDKARDGNLGMIRYAEGIQSIPFI